MNCLRRTQSAGFLALFLGGIVLAGCADDKTDRRALVTAAGSSESAESSPSVPLFDMFRMLADLNVPTSPLDHVLDRSQGAVVGTIESARPGRRDLNEGAGVAWESAYLTVKVEATTGDVHAAPGELVTMEVYKSIEFDAADLRSALIDPDPVLFLTSSEYMVNGNSGTKTPIEPEQPPVSAHQVIGPLDMLSTDDSGALYFPAQPGVPMYAAMENARFKEAVDTYFSIVDK